MLKSVTTNWPMSVALLCCTLLAVCSGNSIHGISSSSSSSSGSNMSSEWTALELIDGPKSVLGAGFGWDYLTQESRYPTHAITFAENKFTDDGKFRIPDCMASESVKRTKFTDTADVIATSYTYVSKTAKSVKLSGSIGIGSVFSVGGSYSKDYSDMMEKQRNTRTVTTRTKFIDHRYSVLTNTRCPLDSKFMAAATDLLFAVEIEDEELALYLAESVVAEYGSHFVRKAKVGGSIYHDNYVDELYWKKNRASAKTVSTSASVNFAVNVINLASSWQSGSTVSDGELSDFNTSSHATNTDAVGGSWTIGMTVEQWGATLLANMVPIDREADLVSNLFLPSTFASMGATPQNVMKAHKYVKESIAKYLGLNSIDGCLDRFSVNYNPVANFDSGKQCDEKVKFGGFYSTTSYCTENHDGGCLQVVRSCPQNNVLTRAQSCPHGYAPVTRVLNRNPFISLTECQGASGDIKTSAVLFGGIFTNVADNPVTGARSCPSGFVAQGLFDCDTTFICLSTDADKAVTNAVPFGGFVSDCMTPANVQCPDGLDQLPITSIRGCAISYCSKIKSFLSPALRKPPFVPKPKTMYRLRSNPYRK